MEICIAANVKYSMFNIDRNEQDAYYDYIRFVYKVIVTQS